MVRGELLKLLLLQAFDWKPRRTTKSKQETAVLGFVPIPVGRSQALHTFDKGTAFDNVFFSSLRPCGIHRCSLSGGIPVPAPLVDIAGRVLDTVKALAFLIGGDRGGRTDIAVVIGGVLHGVLVAPGKLIAVRTARGFLPHGFGGQVLFGPLAVTAGIVIGNLADRVVLPPVDTGHAVR